MEVNEKVLKLKVRAEEIKEQLTYWEEYPPVNNMGKWSTKTRIESIMKKFELLNTGIDIEIDEFNIDK